MKKSYTLLAAIFILIFLLCLNLQAKTKTETLEKNLPVDPSVPCSLEFTDVDGDLSFSSWEKSLVRIRVTKKTRMRDLKKAERLLQETKVDITQRKNKIKIRIHYPKMKGLFFWIKDYSRIKVSTEIMLPLKSNLNCTTVDGSIYGEKIIGEMTMKTVDGSIHLSDIQDSLKAKTTDGRIILKNIKGKVEAKTTDGDIELSGWISKLNLSSIDGDITANILSNSLMEEDWNIDTVDGDVEFSVGSDFSANLFFQTTDGDITSQLPIIVSGLTSKKKISVKINQGGHLVSIKTTDGDITIKRGYSPKYRLFTSSIQKI